VTPTDVQDLVQNLLKPLHVSTLASKYVNMLYVLPDVVFQFVYPQLTAQTMEQQPTKFKYLKVKNTTSKIKQIYIQIRIES
jgi:hypothetical protein